MPTAEIISITTRRPIGEATTNVVAFKTAEPPSASDPMALLSRLAGRALAGGADPSANVGADDELLVLCDEITAIKRQSNAARELFRSSAPSEGLQAYREYKRLDHLARSPILRATKLRATTPAGIFAKAVAVRSCSDQATVMAKSLANDLLASTKLRAVLWPAAAPG